MGIGGISPVQLIIILIIVLLIFGTKKLRNFGGDLGGAIKGFKKAVKEEETDETEEGQADQIEDDSVTGEATATAAKKSTGDEEPVAATKKESGGKES